MPIDIAICIDGTNSVDYKNSSVRNFARSIHADYTIFHDGPVNTVSGSDWIVIQKYVIDRLDK